MGGIIGYTIGDTRAFLCRLQGQTALAQVSAAKYAAAALTAVRQLQALQANGAAKPRPTPPEELRLAVGSDVPLPPVTR